MEELSNGMAGTIQRQGEKTDNHSQGNQPSSYVVLARSLWIDLQEH
jgi:hypothetical protein